jgi:CRISPR-associated endoribonuclease Cas6
MLTSLVIEVEAKSHGKINGGTGGATHGFYYNHWRVVDKNIANNLHAEKETLPFSISPLMNLPNAHKDNTIRIAPGYRAWFRVATLTKQLSDALITQWAAQLPNKVELAGIHWEVIRMPQQHSWTKQVSYQQLANTYLYNKRPPKRWKLIFETPITFRRGENGYLPFPLPIKLIDSWMRRWQAFSPFAISDNLKDRVYNGLFLESYDMNSTTIHYKNGKYPSGEGHCTLQAKKMSIQERAQVDLLANYAFFCGSGYKTTQGMGLTKLR